MDDGEALAIGQPGDLRADLRALLEPHTSLVGRLMTDYVCITTENWVGGLALLVVTACVPLQPLLVLAAPLLFLALRKPAHGFAREILAPQAQPMPERLAESRAALAVALHRIRSSTQRWP